jgi:hypothetical protein
MRCHAPVLGKELAIDGLACFLFCEVGYQFTFAADDIEAKPLSAG